MVIEHRHHRLANRRGRCLRRLICSGWLPDKTGGAQHPSRTYLVGADPPARVFAPDVPDEVTDLVPGVAWMVRLALEGVTTTGQRVLSKAATAIARAGHGVVEDPQQGVFRTPSGVRRYEKPAVSENVTVITMSWWAPGGPLLTRDGVAGLYEGLERLLPEAVPRRWGLGELVPTNRYEDWLIAPREHLKRLHVAMIELLAVDAQSRGDIDEMVAYFERAIASDPYDEAHYLRAAIALAKLQRRGPALRLIERAARMVDDLGLVPDPKLSALHRQLTATD